MRRSRKASSPGGGVALLRARKALDKLKGDNHDQDAGIKIVLRALEEPLRAIVQNAGDEPSVVLNKVAEGKGNFGYNAQTERVRRSRRRWAWSTRPRSRASRCRTRRPLPACSSPPTRRRRAVEEKKNAGGGHGRGGMGGMGGMDMDM